MERVRALTDQLEAGITGLFQSGQYAAYLQSLSKLHHYSYGNIFLIKLQCPHASMVAGYGDWKRKFGRHVKAGETGITILAPCPYHRRRSPSPVSRPLQRRKNPRRGRPSRSRSRHRRRTGGNRSRLRPKPPAQPPGKSRCIKSGWLWRDRGRAWHIRISPLDGKSKCPPITIQIKRRTVLRN